MVEHFPSMFKALCFNSGATQKTQCFFMQFPNIYSEIYEDSKKIKCSYDRGNRKPLQQAGKECSIPAALGGRPPCSTEATGGTVQSRRAEAGVAHQCSEDETVFMSG